MFTRLRENEEAGCGDGGDGGHNLLESANISPSLYLLLYSPFPVSERAFSSFFFASEALPCRITTSQIRPWLLTTVKVVVYYHYH